MVHARQMKAARALLDWSQQELAEAANLSPTTVRNMESGDISPRNATAKIIRRIFEESGIEFLEGKGVRLRSDAVVVYQGDDGGELFIDDVSNTIRQKGGEVICVFKSHDMLLQSFGMTPGSLGYLATLCQLTNVRCIMPSMLSKHQLAFTFSSRVVPKQYIGPSSYVVYGNKYAIILSEGRSSVRYVVFSCPNAAIEYKNYFDGLWEMGSSDNHQNKPRS